MSHSNKYKHKSGRFFVERAAVAKALVQAAAGHAVRAIPKKVNFDGFHSDVNPRGPSTTIMGDTFVQRFLEIRIAERYQLCQRLGAGSFGIVYLGEWCGSPKI